MCNFLSGYILNWNICSECCTIHKYSLRLKLIVDEQSHIDKNGQNPFWTKTSVKLLIFDVGWSSIELKQRPYHAIESSKQFSMCTTSTYWTNERTQYYNLILIILIPFIVIARFLNKIWHGIVERIACSVASIEYIFSWVSFWAGEWYLYSIYTPLSLHRVYIH